jgi:hypothetical protein
MPEWMLLTCGSLSGLRGAWLRLCPQEGAALYTCEKELSLWLTQRSPANS